MIDPVIANNAGPRTPAVPVVSTRAELARSRSTFRTILGRYDPSEGYWRAALSSMTNETTHNQTIERTPSRWSTPVRSATATHRPVVEMSSPRVVIRSDSHFDTRAPSTAGNAPAPSTTASAESEPPPCSVVRVSSTGAPPAPTT